MKERIKSIWEQGGYAAGWTKIGMLASTGIVAIVLFWNQGKTNTSDIEQLSIYQKNHYSIIQKQEKEILLLKVASKNLEKELSTYKGEQKQVNYEQSQFNNETLKALVRLNTVNEENDKQSARQK